MSRDRYWIRTTGQTGPGIEAHLADTSDAHDASAISFSATGTISSTDVQAAIAEVSGDVTSHTGQSSGAHAATAISYAGSTNLSATTVEAALDELDSEKLPRSATQAGTAASPTAETQWSYQPAETASYAPFESHFKAETYSGNVETTWSLGYNASRGVATEPSAWIKFHPDAEDTPGNRAIQLQFDVMTPNGTQIPIMKARALRDDSSTMSVTFAHGLGASDVLSINDGAASPYVTFSKQANASQFSKNVQINPANTLMVEFQTGVVYVQRACPIAWNFTGSKKLLQALNNAGNTFHDLVQYSSGDVLRFGDNNAARTLGIQLELDKGTLTLSRGSTKLNVGIGGTSYGSGDGVVFIQNTAAAPSGTPSGGGVLYVESGALKFKGTSGTVTTVAVA